MTDYIKMAIDAGAWPDCYLEEYFDMSRSAIETLCKAVRAAALEEALNCYSPDDLAHDWADKIRALKEKRND
jgi:hypothetical protein